jgi:hypothetical protein
LQTRLVFDDQLIIRKDKVTLRVLNLLEAGFFFDLNFNRTAPIKRRSFGLNE